MTTSTFPWHEILGLRQLWSCHQLWTKKIQFRPAPLELSANSGFVVALFPRGRASPTRPSCTSRHCVDSVVALVFAISRGRAPPADFATAVTHPRSTSTPVKHQIFERCWPASTTQKRARRSRSHLSPHPSSFCHSPSTVRKRLCCCDNSTRELLWHSEHKERGESRDSELPLHTSLISSGNSMPPARPPNPPGKERPLHLTSSAIRLQWRGHRHRARNTPHFSSSRPSSLQTRLFGQPYFHSSLRSGEESLSDRRALSSAIMCRPIKAHAFTVSTEKQGPNSITMRPILPWNVPRRGCCAQTHAVPRIQQRPTNFPQRLVPHLWYHA